MTRTVLPASVFPDVLIAKDGSTYVALPMPGQLIILRNGAFQAQLIPGGTWPRFCEHVDGVLVAYKNAETNALDVCNVTAGGITHTGLPAFYNSPLCWREDGYLSVQATDLPISVWGGLWPALPAAPAIRQGVGTGLAQWLNGELKTWDELGVTVQPVYLTGASVQQAQEGGVQITLGSATGVLEPGTYSNNPRPALAADGSLTFVYWTQDGHGATSTVLYQGVTAADLQPALPSVESVQPFAGARAFGAFEFGE